MQKWLAARQAGVTKARAEHGQGAACTVAQGLEAAFGVANLTNVSLAEKSPLFTHVEPPRTWRLTLRGNW